MATDNQYWFARRSNSWWGRSQYAVLHWKGFVLLFFGALLALSFLVVGFYFLAIVMANSESWVIKVFAGLSGLVSIGMSFWIIMRINLEKAERTDPDVLAAEYRKKLFGSFLAK